MTDEDIEFLNAFSEKPFSVENSLGDYERFVRIAVSNEDTKATLDGIIDQLELTSLVTEWRESEEDQSTEGYVKFVSSLLYSYTNVSNTLRNALVSDEDNFELVADNICCSMQAMITNSLLDHSFGELCFFAAATNLTAYVAVGSLTYGDVERALEEVFWNDRVVIGDTSFHFPKQFTRQRHKLHNCVTKIILATLSLLLPIDNPNIKDGAIVDALQSKALEIDNFVRRKLYKPLMYKDDVVRRLTFLGAVKTDEAMVEASKNLGSRTLIDGLDIRDFPRYKFIDFIDDFDADGFSKSDAISFANSFFGRVNQAKEVSDYLAFLDSKRPIMSKTMEEFMPALGKDEVEGIYSSRFQVRRDFIPAAGICYLFGVYVDRDFEKAAELFELGSEKMIAECSYQLSVMYLKRLIPSQGPTRWIEELNRACMLGDENAISQWNDLRQKWLICNIGRGIKIGEPEYKSVVDGVIKAEGGALLEGFNRRFDQTIEPYKIYCPNYNKQLSWIFSCGSCFSTLSEIKRILAEPNVDSIDSSLAEQIADAFGSDDVVGICWYIYLQDIGVSELKKLIMESYGNVLLYHYKNEKTDELCYKYVMETQSFSLLSSYLRNGRNEDLLLKLFNDGFLKASGYLMASCFKSMGIEQSRSYASIFRSVASEEEIKEVSNCIYSNYRQFDEDTNYRDYLAKKTNVLVQKTKSSSSGGCYIATCVYGSYDCPEVWVLRRFRDYKLNKTVFGRTFIRIYYAMSPTLVKWFGETKWFKAMWRRKLNRMVKKYKAQGFDDTPYNDVYSI